MNKFLALMVTLFVAVFSVNAFAFDPPPPPSDGFYVVDLAGKLSTSQKTRLNHKIEQVNQATKNEFGILLLQDMGGDNIEDVANATYKKWGIGKRGLDNGCLIVVSIKERKSRIETGKGVEGDVPDLKANDILKKNLNPHLKNGDFYGGFDETLGALQSLIESRHTQKADPPPANTTSGPRTSGGCDIGGAVGGGFSIFFLVVLGAIGFLIFLRHRDRKAEEAEAKRRADLRTAERLRRLRDQQALREALDAQRAKAAREAEREVEEEKKRVSSIPTPAVEVPVVTRPAVPRPSARPQPISKPPSSPPPTSRADAAAAAAMAAASAVTLMERRKREEAERAEQKKRREAEARREREQEERRARERREEDDRRRRRQEEESRSSSSSSSSFSFDWGSSSSDSGSGFGGGDSGGGGSSSDW